MKVDRRNPWHWVYLALFTCSVLAAIVLRLVRRPSARKRIVLYGHKLNGNLLALYRHYRQSPDAAVDVEFLTMDPAYHRRLVAQGVPSRLAQSPRGTLLMAAADAVVSDHGLHAMSLMPGLTDLRFVDVWHGVPFKGFDADDFRVQHRYDEVWVSSPLLREIYVRQYGFDAARVHAIGYARTDRLVTRTDDLAAARRRLGLPEGPIVLFAPTWQQDERGRSLFPFGLEGGAFLEALARTCARHGATVVMRAHLNSRLAACAPGTLFFPHAEFPDTEELLLLSDALICDWSSIAFDYLLLDRPTIFLDVPAPFRKGFSLGPEHRFGPVVADLEGLCQRLDQALASPERYRAEFGARHAAERAAVYGEYADGRASARGAERLARLIQAPRTP